MQEEVEARQRAEAEAARLAEEQRIRVCLHSSHAQACPCVLTRCCVCTCTIGPHALLELGFAMVHSC